MATGLPDNLISLLAAADKRNGFPDGTMYAVLQQESGGNSKYLNDPSTYHYGLNAQGKRVAGHTGKVSTAFGPFGILESTGAQPGYGVSPLKDKSLEEQVRFASDYLAARSKSAGGLEAGLAGYGEGKLYGQQVAAKIGKGMPVAAPVQVAQATQAAPVQLAQMEVPVAAPVDRGPAPVGYVAPGAAPSWDSLNAVMPQQPVQVADLNYGAHFPEMGLQQAPRRNLDPNFQAFGKWKARV